MAQLYVKYNPYKLETILKVNGKSISEDSGLYKLTRGKRMQEWIRNFPTQLVDELNTVEFDIEFYGMPLDWDDFKDVFERAKSQGIVKKAILKFVEGKGDTDITEKIIRVFTDLQEGPVEDFRDSKLLKAFKNINNSIFPINVIATMSSGKSTLINALLSKRLMPAKNEACTATITEILDNDVEKFSAVAYDEENTVLREVSDLSYEIMNELNDDEKVHRIEAQGNISFIDAKNMALMLVDTPGPNNSQNQAHKNMTYRAISNDSNSLILYVLNGTQLRTNDDATLLSYVSKQIKKGGKQVRDRFLFVINKMDTFNPEEENIENVMEAAKQYLATYGIEEPQVFPCSASTALNIKTYFQGIELQTLNSLTEAIKLPFAAQNTLIDIYKFNNYENMYLEKYSTLSPSAQEELDFKLNQAVQAGNYKEQALIHCGIYSIQAAIIAYVKKYAKTKKVKDLVESFQEILESTQILTKAKTQVATDEEMAKSLAERAEMVKSKIADGEEASEFKKKIALLNPIEVIKGKAEKLQIEATKRTGRVFQPYGDVISSREEAKRLVSQFTVMSSDYIAELTTELESVISREVMETGEKILAEYQEKLSKIDNSTQGKQLEFGTADLIKGTLYTMKEKAESWCSEEFATETVDDVGEVTYEEKVYYEKVGQKAEKVFVGTEQVKSGTKKVKVGSHKELVGTKTVKNPKREGFFGFFKIWHDKYIEENVYETVDDYRDEDVYKTVNKYETVMKDIFEERKEKIEKFSVETSVIQSGLVSKLRKNLDEGIVNAIEYAEDEIESMKKQFMILFEELDLFIQQKYAELQECANDQKTKEEELEKNKKILHWIESCKTEIDEILEI